MNALQDQVLGVGDQGFLVLGVFSPQDEDHGGFPLGQEADDVVREPGPAQGLVGIGLRGPNGEDGVEQQHPLVRPLHQISVVGHGAAQVRLQFLEDVHQGRGSGYAGFYGKTETMGLAWPVVGINCFM